MKASIVRSDWPADASNPTTLPGSAKASGRFLEPAARCRSNGASACPETIVRCAARAATIGCDVHGKRWTTTFLRGDGRRSSLRWCANFEWDGGRNGARWRTHRSSPTRWRLRCSRRFAHRSASPRAQCNCITSPTIGDIRRIAASRQTPVRIRVPGSAMRTRMKALRSARKLIETTKRIASWILFRSYMATHEMGYAWRDIADAIRMSARTEMSARVNHSHTVPGMGLPRRHRSQE